MGVGVGGWEWVWVWVWVWKGIGIERAKLVSRHRTFVDWVALVEVGYIM